jgi:hypothetical protein
MPINYAKKSMWLRSELEVLMKKRDYLKSVWMLLRVFNYKNLFAYIPYLTFFFHSQAASWREVYRHRRHVTQQQTTPPTLLGITQQTK